jgi:hypothetical protein
MNQRFYILIISILAGIVFYQWNELNEKTVTTPVENKEKEKELLERKNKDITKIYCEVVRVPTEEEIDEIVKSTNRRSELLKKLKAELSERNKERGVEDRLLPRYPVEENQDSESDTEKYYSNAFIYSLDKEDARKNKKQFKEDRLLEDILMYERILKETTYHKRVSSLSIKADAIITTRYIGNWENKSHDYLHKYNLAENGLGNREMKIWKIGLADGRELLVRDIEAKNKYGHVVKDGIRHLH